MNCDDVTKLVEGYVDCELDPIANQKVEEHLRECASCQQVYKAQNALVRAIGNNAPYYRASAELRQRVQSALRDETGGHSVGSISRDGQRRVKTKRREPRGVPFAVSWNWLALAAAIVLAAIVVPILAPQLRRPSADQFLATQLISSHVRSLMANHLTDVASSDQHTVKPWLDAKLDFAPAVVDLTSEGFPLVGGRLDYLDNRPVAALIYQRRKHFINLFVWPAGSDATQTPKTIARQGYQLVHWVDSDFNYWAVSDVSEKDLQTLKQLLEQQTARH